MNVGRPPRVGMIFPGISARLYGNKFVKTIRVSKSASGAGEVGIEGRWVVVFDVQVAPGGIGLPDFNQSVRQRVTIIIEHAPADDDALAQRFSRMLAGQIAVAFAEIGMSINRAGHLADRVRQENQWLRWRPAHSGAIWLI